MRIVFPEGTGCVQTPEDLLPLEKIGSVDFHKTPPKDKRDLMARLQDADVVFLDYSVMDAEVIERCGKLKLVCFLGVGYSTCIDVEAATRQGVTVTYTPDYGATSVAEFAFGMILSLVRHIAFSYHSLQKGEWETIRFQGRELHGKTLGLLGLGPIGTEVARLGAGIGMKLLGWTRNARPERAKHGLRLVSSEELFSSADVISVHLAYNAQTERLVSGSLLGRMKPSAYFVNTARAKIVDTQALAALLAAGKIAGAALDVHEEEPIPEDYLFRSLPNVLITPHIGYNTREAGLNMLRIGIATLEAFLRGEKLHVVNPGVVLPLGASGLGSASPP